MGGKKFCLFGLLLLLWLNPIKALASPVHLQVQNAPTGTVLMSVARSNARVSVHASMSWHTVA